MSKRVATSGKPSQQKKTKVEEAPVPAAPSGKFSAKPPATVTLETAESLHLSAAELAHWCSDAGGKAAARRGPEYSTARLLGTCKLRFTYSAHGLEGLVSTFGLLERKATGQLERPKPRPAAPRWGWQTGRPAGRQPPMENWDVASGEFSGQGFVSPRGLLAAVLGGDLMTSGECDEYCDEFLVGLESLCLPDPKLWGCPLIRAVIPTTRELEAAADAARAKPRKKKAAAKKGPEQAGGGGHDSSLILSVHVYGEVHTRRC